jgi:tetratricopeptide (TPR) repeat protein
MLVLEDAHWAASLARDTLLHVARTAGDAPLLVVVTTRDTAPDLDASLTNWLAEAQRLPVCEVVALEGIGVEATQELVAALGSQIDVADAHHATGGNPLFLREMATADGLSATLADFLANRFERLEEDDLAVADTAAVLGETFVADLVARAVERPVEEVMEALERAEDAGLVQQLSATPLRYAFVHALFRDTRVDSLGAGRRMRLHAAAATALEARADDPAVLPDLARHACIAAPLGDAEAAVDLARRAGALAFTIGDSAAAARHYQRALDAIDLTDRPDERLRLELTIRLGEATVLPDSERGWDILRTAARMARRLDDPEALADAVCSMTAWAGSISPGEEDPVFVALAEEALDLLPRSATVWRARLMALLGVHLHLGYHQAEGLAMAREALELAKACGDPMTEVKAALSMRYILGPPDKQERLAIAEDAFDTAVAHGYDGLAELAASSVSLTLRSMGRFDDARAWQRRALERSPVTSAGTLISDAGLALAQGDLEQVERQAERTLAVVPPELTHLYHGGITLMVEALRGRAHADLARPFAGRRTFVEVAMLSYLAWAHVLDGDLDEACTVLTEGRESGFARIVGLLTGATALARFAEVADACGDVDAAEELLEVLQPLAGDLADDGPTLWCSIDHSRALLLLTTGDAEAAATAAEGAVEASRRRGTTIFLARELLVLARARRDLGAAPDDVRPLLAEASAIADDTGAGLVRLDAARFDLAGLEAGP